MATVGRKKAKEAIPLSAAAEAKVERGIQDELSEWNLVLTDKPWPSRIGGHACKPGTGKIYDGIYCQLERFCTMIGDYRSMLILHEHCPNDVVPMQPSTLVLFMKYKFSPPGTPLLDSQQLPVMEAGEDKPIGCSGAWHNPQNLDVLQAAVRVLHRNKGDNKDAYREVCSSCKDLPRNLQYQGCRRHTGCARLVPKGDPTQDLEFVNTIKRIKKDNEGYEERGAMPLLPWDVRRIRQTMMTNNTVNDYQFYVALLVSIRLFLRFDEFSNLEIDHFETNLHIIQNNGVEGLVLRIKGKSDTNWIRLILWKDDECPEFCPVRHILTYVKMAGIKGGSLFPSHAELNNPPSDGFFKTTLDYNVFLTTLKWLCTKVLKKGNDFKIGTHTGRKTAYLFAVFGGGSELDIQHAARHKSESNSGKYRLEAQTLYEIQKVLQNNEANRVGKWRSVYLERVTNAHSGLFAGNDIPLPVLAHEFVVNRMRISTTDALANQPFSLSEALLGY